MELGAQSWDEFERAICTDLADDDVKYDQVRW